ncbi:hypothetical protein [Ruminococcus sp. Marseille-P6503]|uniref:hypothetical protein n=1 Tax=Ruminococcus sp. Marseille-P6503 TaxID=2364796 RepID=UPI0013DDB936|nr:hypothetical protein [Ruminococcus sp. Marseille-P6503]
MNKEITEMFNDCEVTIAFKNKAEPIKDQVLWLILESFKERIETQFGFTVDP